MLETKRLEYFVKRKRKSRDMNNYSKCPDKLTIFNF